MVRPRDQRSCDRRRRIGGALVRGGHQRLPDRVADRATGLLGVGYSVTIATSTADAVALLGAGTRFSAVLIFSALWLLVSRGVPVAVVRPSVRRTPIAEGGRVKGAAEILMKKG